MQLRAYDLWNSLLGSGHLPAIADLRPGDHPSISTYGVLLDFTGGAGDPRIAFLGESLAVECGVAGIEVARVSQMPERSLLARIADHYLKAVVSPEPIGFEAEFINQRDRKILYRGILLPFSRDRTAVDFVFGVINWKELAEQALVDGLLHELGQALCGTSDDGAGEPGEVEGSTDALRAIGPGELQAIDAAGGNYSLVAIGRTGAGDPVVLGEVKRGTALFERAAGRTPG